MRSASTALGQCYWPVACISPLRWWLSLEIKVYWSGCSTGFWFSQQCTLFSHSSSAALIVAGASPSRPLKSHILTQVVIGHPWLQSGSVAPSCAFIAGTELIPRTYNNRLHSDRFSAASRLQTGA